MRLHCDFCGLDFESDCAAQSCTGCPLAQGCGRVTCPRCGYGILLEAGLVRWLRRLRQAWQPTGRSEYNLTHPAVPGDLSKPQGRLTRRAKDENQ